MLQEKSPKMSEGDILAKDRRILLSAFQDDALEKLYQTYSRTQKRAGLECFLFAGILFDLFILIVPAGQEELVYALVSVVLLCKCGVWYRCKTGSPTAVLWGALPHLVWVVTVAEFLLLVGTKTGGPTWRDHLGWAILFVYLLYVTLPMQLRYCVVISVGTACAYVLLLVLVPKDDANQISQILANCALLVSATILGLLSYFVEEKHQRRAFLETRQSLEMKLLVQEQSAEQEQLLLSVLPEHVAVQMRQDLDSADSQFKKIYMSRHENVSILYADIVGFTAISSTYSAQELVKMLNELFARFDKLADKFHQLRIKILGDCYYCISGAPQERPDHAVLCVHMGLSMVKAIKYVQQTTNSPVDMRVGIHTGAVLAGVLGQRQWQFDVYSRDVELANKMESSGKAGRVHISATTLSFLSGEFEVDAAFGEKREEALRIAGLKTYFIVKVLKPHCSEKNQENYNGAGVLHDEDSCVIADVTSDSKEDEAFEDSGPRHINASVSNQQRHDSGDFKKRLQKELVSRDGHRELAKSTKFLNLAFLKQDVEDAYHRHTEVYSNVILQGFVVVRFFISISQFIALPMGLLNFSSFIGGSAILMIISTSSLAEIIPQEIYCGMWRCCMKINESIWMRRILSALCIIVLTAANIIDTISCSQWDNYTTVNCSFNSSHHLHIIDQYQSCLYPSYYSYFGVLVLIVAALPASLSYISKTVLMLGLALTHCLANVCVLAPALDCEENRSQWEIFTKGEYTLSILLLTATIILAFLARHMEQVARVLFLWRSEVEEQKECASDMRRRNEALVYNILPPHVAEHFLGNRKRQHDELYSQSYAEVGVLFASMPNFSDFYSEETVNNQGLECLRFLNEVISDFDALTELPQFQDIIKIKTIGSTYMAASGLNPTKHVKPDDPITVRWANLALLVDFALELKKALQSINEQSFNHFVLKMGINHGPITAGVIGARKPHYDIWGNTVNVASRMESTGKAGCIQVTEDTCEILQHFGYTFEQRGLVAVKGKGQLMTYYLQGKSSINTSCQRSLITSPPHKLITVDPNLVTLTTALLNNSQQQQQQQQQQQKSVAITMELSMTEDTGTHTITTANKSSDDKTVIECSADSSGMDTRSDMFNELDNGACCLEGSGGDVGGKETTESTHLLG